MFDITPQLTRSSRLSIAGRQQSALDLSWSQVPDDRISQGLVLSDQGIHSDPDFVLISLMQWCRQQLQGHGYRSMLFSLCKNLWAQAPSASALKDFEAFTLFAYLWGEFCESPAARAATQNLLIGDVVSKIAECHLVSDSMVLMAASLMILKSTVSLISASGICARCTDVAERAISGTIRPSMNNIASFRDSLNAALTARDKRLSQEDKTYARIFQDCVRSRAHRRRRFGVLDSEMIVRNAKSLGLSPSEIQQIRHESTCLKSASHAGSVLGSSPEVRGSTIHPRTTRVPKRG